jgi:hypothetical protein
VSLRVVRRLEYEPNARLTPVLRPDRVPFFDAGT